MNYNIDIKRALDGRIKVGWQGIRNGNRIKYTNTCRQWLLQLLEEESHGFRKFGKMGGKLWIDHFHTDMDHRKLGMYNF